MNRLLRKVIFFVAVFSLVNITNVSLVGTASADAPAIVKVTRNIVTM